MYNKPDKAQYTETEVADELGLSVDRLRALIKERLLIDEADAGYTASVSYQPSDLLLLKLLAANLQTGAAQG